MCGLYGFSYYGDKPVKDLYSQLLPANKVGANVIISNELKHKFRLDINEALTAQEAFQSMMHFFSADEGKTDMMIIYSIIGCMRSVLQYSKVFPNFSLIVHGNTQTKKTTALSFATSLYNRSDTLKFNTVRIDSSVPYTESMSEEYADTCIIFDDLFKNPHKSSEAEIKVITLLRETADNAPRYTIRGGHKINAQLAMTAEYLIDDLSDLGRVWAVHVNKSIDEERLSECQLKPLDIPTFMRNYISWIYEHFESITKDINDEWQKFRREQNNHPSRYRRLDEAEFVFQIVFDKVLEYGFEIGALNEEECHKSMRDFSKRLNECKQRQIMIMKKVEAAETNNLNYAKALVDCIEYNIIVPDYKGSDCFVHTVKGVKCIYIRSEYLMDTLNFQYNQKHTLKYYTKYFKEKNLLYLNSSSNMVKFKDNRCYLAIRLDRLKFEVCCDDYKIERLFYDLKG